MLWSPPTATKEVFDLSPINFITGEETSRTTLSLDLVAWCVHKCQKRLHGWLGANRDRSDSCGSCHCVISSKSMRLSSLAMSPCCSDDNTTYRNPTKPLLRRFRHNVSFHGVLMSRRRPFLISISIKSPPRWRFNVSFATKSVLDGNCQTNPFLVKSTK